MTVSDDEYDAQAGGAIELTEEDCIIIDALSATNNPQIQATRREDVPHIEVAVAQDNSPPISKSHRPFGSPFQRYRKYGRLSVTDLVSPAWCEVQFEYGLQQQRSRHIEKRPQTFVSRTGKQIRVGRNTAQMNDVVLREGHAVHTALEREIHPVKAPVKVDTPEEYWGLRLFNMISDIQTLKLVGKCLSVISSGTTPSSGFSHHDQDEIIRTPIPHDQSVHELQKKKPLDASVPNTPSKSKPKRPKSRPQPSSPDGQLKINSFFPVTPSKSPRAMVVDTPVIETAPSDVAMPSVGLPGTSGGVRRTHKLRLVDCKTRLSPSLPHDSATLSSRLQLMTYKRLLDALLFSSPPFDFDRLWGHLRVGPERTFSEAFMARIQILNVEGNNEIKCLRNLENTLRGVVGDLGLGMLEDELVQNGAAVDEQLTLVYRLRASGPGRDKKGLGSNHHYSLNKSREAEDLRTALRASIRHSLGPGQEGGGFQEGKTEENALVDSLLQASEPGIGMQLGKHASTLKPGSPSPDLELAVQESLKVGGTEPGWNETRQGDIPAGVGMIDGPAGGAEEPSQSVPDVPVTQPGDIIGEKQFKHDDTMLDTYLADILLWWHGEREPRGVELEDSSRCNTCEYISGCEWRETMFRHP